MWFLSYSKNYICKFMQSNSWHKLLRLCKTQNALQLPMFFFLLFFCLRYRGLRNCKSIFLILKIWQLGGLRRWVQHFPRYPCKFDIRIDISISTRPMITKFGKHVHLQDLNQMRLIMQVLVTSLLQDHVTN